MDHTRLYYGDSYTDSFKTKLEQRVTVNGKPAVILEQSYFYPASGGQLHDLGTINGIPVIEVVEHEGRVAHILECNPPTEWDGSELDCRIDRQRRFNMMQHHSGQHILSQAFNRVADANTVSIHLSEDGVCTVDLDNPKLSEDAIDAAETLANEIVQSNMQVRAYIVTDEELPQIPLRKPPKVQGEIRIVQIGDFDWSACGGTHVAGTGEVGMIKIRRAERRGGNTRVEFLCGKRALEDYAIRNRAVNEIASLLSSKDRDVAEAVRRLQDESKQKSREIAQLQERLLDYEARDLIAAAPVLPSGARLVRLVMNDRPMDAVRLLAQRLTAQPNVVALLALLPQQANPKGPQVQICFASSAGLPYNMGALVKQACKTLGGSGGGSPTLAQGGGSDAGKIEAALDAAQAEL